MRDAEAKAAAAFGSIAARGDQRLGLLARFDHRHHDAERARVEHRARSGDRRTPARAPSARCRRRARTRLRLDGLDADAAVLHVEQHELRAGGGEHRRQAGREELERHHAERGAAARSVSRTGLRASHARLIANPGGQRHRKRARALGDLAARHGVERNAVALEARARRGARSRRAAGLPRPRRQAARPAPTRPGDRSRREMPPRRRTLRRRTRATACC